MYGLFAPGNKKSIKKTYLDWLLDTTNFNEHVTLHLIRLDVNSGLVISLRTSRARGPKSILGW